MVQKIAKNFFYRNRIFPKKKRRNYCKNFYTNSTEIIFFILLLILRKKKFKLLTFPLPPSKHHNRIHWILFFSLVVSMFETSFFLLSSYTHFNLNTKPENCILRKFLLCFEDVSFFVFFFFCYFKILLSLPYKFSL